MIIRLPYHVECNAVVVFHHVVCYLTMEVRIVRQNKYLLDIGTGDIRMQHFNIVMAHTDHFPDHGAHNEQSAAVHAGNRIIDHDDLISSVHYICNFTGRSKDSRICSSAALNQMIEVQERNKVPFALAQTLYRLIAITNHFITVLDTRFLAKGEALEAGVLQHGIHALKCFIRIDGITALFLYLRLLIKIVLTECALFLFDCLDIADYKNISAAQRVTVFGSRAEIFFFADFFGIVRRHIPAPSRSWSLSFC